MKKSSILLFIYFIHLIYKEVNAVPNKKSSSYCSNHKMDPDIHHDEKVLASYDKSANCYSISAVKECPEHLEEHKIENFNHCLPKGYKKGKYLKISEWVDDCPNYNLYFSIYCEKHTILTINDLNMTILPNHDTLFPDAHNFTKILKIKSYSKPIFEILKNLDLNKFIQLLPYPLKSYTYNNDDENFSFNQSKIVKFEIFENEFSEKEQIIIIKIIPIGNHDDEYYRFWLNSSMINETKYFTPEPIVYIFLFKFFRVREKIMKIVAK